MPPVDLRETPDHYVVTAEVSGLAAGRHPDPDPGRQADAARRAPRRASRNRERFERVERGHGRFARTFVLPQPVDVAAITADLQNGVLTVTVPKQFDRRRIDVQ